MPSPQTAIQGKPLTSVRWTVCALLFFATTIIYLDRQVVGFLAKTLATSIGWNDIQYGWINFGFQIAYGVGLLGAGRLLDRIGTRKGFALAIGAWSVAVISTAAARSALSFGAARAALGLAEAANFPGGVKTLAEWFPKRERATAMGIFNSGANIGAVLAPLTVPFLALTFGWQSAFIATGSLGFVWVTLWLILYRKPAEHRRVSSSELAYIQSDPPDKAELIPWSHLLKEKGAWQFGIGKFMTDPAWWFFIFWLPKYLQDTFGLSMKEIIWPTLVVYNISTVGSVAGGWLSSRLIARGWRVHSARRAAMMTCALCVTPVVTASYCKSLWLVVIMVGIAMAAHQGWSANLFTLVSDRFPRNAVASVTGIGGAMGTVTSALIQVVAGYVVQLTHSYLPLFVFCGTTYLLALGVMSRLDPKPDAA